MTQNVSIIYEVIETFF